MRPNDDINSIWNFAKGVIAGIVITAMIIMIFIALIKLHDRVRIFRNTETETIGSVQSWQVEKREVYPYFLPV